MEIYVVDRYTFAGKGTLFMKSQTPYDVRVIGSGAAGGIMAKELAEAGAETILIEAGPQG